MAAIITTDRRGRQVALGTTAEVRHGQVLAATFSYGGALQPVEVVSLGQPWTDNKGRQMVYGYLDSQPTQPAGPRHPRHSTQPGNTHVRACPDCQDIEDASDGRGCALHRGRPQT